MKKLACIIGVLGMCLSLQGQNLFEIALSQGIVANQNFTLSNANGMSFYDFDEDGWDDLTYPMHNDSIIFYKNFNGNLIEIGSMLYSEGTIRQILWVDYDNDGYLDLCISYDNYSVRLYKNNGDYTFEDVSVSSGIYPSVQNPYGFSFADPDQDNDLDLYLASYDTPGNPYTNIYYENQGDGTFIDKSSEMGIDNGTYASFIGVWFDYNNDDLIDLHVINDREFGDDALYENQGSSFINVATTVGVSNAGKNPMTSSISDFNNDGFQDIFVTDFGMDSVNSGDGPFHYKLFQNQDGVSFNNVAESFDMHLNDFGWGALWVDYNNDMYEDLYIATGNTINNQGLPTAPIFYRNDAGIGFSKINDSIVGEMNTVSFCPVKGDINNDGFYEIAVLNQDVPPHLLLNEGNSNNYLKITPVGLVSNRMAIGSEIRLYAGGIQQLQTVFCGEQLCAQNSQHKIFGIGQNLIVDSIWVSFPSGLIAKRYDVPANQSITIYEETFSTVNFNLIENLDSVLLCLNDTIEITLSGYDNYGWNTGALDSTLYITAPGTYFFEAYNSSEDTLFRSHELIVSLEEMPLYQVLTTDISCNDEFSGGSVLQFVNPTAIDTVFWSSGDSGFFIDSVLEGNYTFTFQTNNQCYYNDSVYIGEMGTMNIQYQTTPYTGTSYGSVSISIFGGSPPFVYVIDGDTLDSNIDSLLAGTYTLVVYDSFDCMQEETITIQNESTVGINRFDQEASIYLSEEIIHICAESLLEQNLEVYSLSGSRIGLRNPRMGMDNCMEFDFHHPSGVYIAILRTSNSVTRSMLYKP